MEQLIADIIETLNSFADPKRIEFAKNSYPTKMQVIGVTNPNLKIVLKELKNITKSNSIDEKYKIAQMLVETDIFECQQLAHEFIGNDKKNIKYITREYLNTFNKNMDNWVSVDYYGALFIGYAWREHIIETSDVKCFLNSDDFWIRRIAVVATVALNQKARGGKGDVSRTLEICELVVDDHEDMINKALSWALRELAKINTEPVHKFLIKHQNKLHKRVLREVNNKLNFGVKNLKE